MPAYESCQVCTRCGGVMQFDRVLELWYCPSERRRRRGRS
jgi:hypothetical protein